MRGTTNQGYMSSGFDHQRMLNDSFFAGRFDHSGVMNDNSITQSSPDMLGLRDLRNALVNPSRQPTPSILNMTPPDKNFHQVNSELCSSEMMDKTERLVSDFCGLNMRETRSPKLMLDLSRVKNTTNMIPTRNNGSSPPFSDSSLSTSSSNLDMGFFPHSLQTGRSDSPNSEASNSSVESALNHNNNNFTFPPLTDQELTNLQNLHVINCMTSLSANERFMQTINMIQSVMHIQQNSSPITENDTLESEARYHRTAAVSGNVEAQYTWSGKLPKRSHKGGPYSTKVFLGGVPWDVTQDILTYSFQQFGNVKVEWPGKEAIAQPKGYVYIIFENELNVKSLLESCREGVGENDGSFYYKIPSRKSKPKEVQVIPWSISDSNYSKKTFQKLDPLKTIFVGALHGMMNAEGLFRVMDDLFGGVLYAGIDTDKDKYPIGSGRCTFDNYKSYVKAVTAAFVDIKTPKFNKKVQMDPYLEDTPCSSCHIQLGPFFCRENGCFRYFCTSCWKAHHALLRLPHKPMSRNSKHGSSTNAMVPSH